MNESMIQRAEILFQQNRFEEAQKIINQLLGADPYNIHLLAMSCEIALELNDTRKAEGIINGAISYSPDLYYLYYIKARVMLALDHYDDAETCLQEATRINPEDANSFALWASVKLIRKQFKAALNLANKALELDAENILGLNTKSTALLKLNQKKEAFDTINEALKEDPNNSFTHSNVGWGVLEKGNHKEALKHFQEALKNNPNNELAQAGMIEALKAKYLVYRLFLKYAFWMSNMTAKYQWAVIIGFYLGFKGLRFLAKSNPALQPFLYPILITLAIFAFSTWVITPVSNLFLRLNKFGKHLLDKKEKMSSNFVGLSALILITGILIYIFTREDKWLTVAAFGFVMMVPLGSMFAPTKTKNALLYYAVAMLCMGSLAIFTTFTTDKLFNQFSMLFVFGFIGYQWLANYLVIKEDNV